jgi:serine/threonine protein kinase
MRVSLSADDDARREPPFDRYFPIERIEGSGRGTVWRARDRKLDTECALMLIDGSYTRNDVAWERFEHQTRGLTELNHPCIVAPFEVGRARKVSYVVMDLINGRSLEKVIAERGGEPIGLEWIADILGQLCSALEAAHAYVDEKTGKSQPIVHRDINLSQLMLDESQQPGPGPRIKVLGFGIAELMESPANPEEPGVSHIFGRPGTRSPEQIRGGFTANNAWYELDGRSDIYSTGLLLYQLLTGTLPYRGIGVEIMHAHLNSSPPPMKEANPKAEVPSGVERVVMQCLEKDPSRRPQTARELAESFRAAIDRPRRQESDADRILSSRGWFRGFFGR